MSLETNTPSRLTSRVSLLAVGLDILFAGILVLVSFGPYTSVFGDSMQSILAVARLPFAACLLAVEFSPYYSHSLAGLFAYRPSDPTGSGWIGPSIGVLRGLYVTKLVLFATALAVAVHLSRKSG